MPATRERTAEEAHQEMIDAMSADPTTTQNNNTQHEEATTSKNSENKHKGLVIAGAIVGRTRRYVGNDQREVVDYKVLAGDTTYTVSEWEPKEYEAVGWDIYWPISVSVRMFGGAPRYTLTRCKLEHSNF